jgi:hypothetical protein
MNDTLLQWPFLRLLLLLPFPFSLSLPPRIIVLFRIGPFQIDFPFSIHNRKRHTGRCLSSSTKPPRLVIAGKRIDGERRIGEQRARRTTQLEGWQRWSRLCLEGRGGRDGRMCVIMCQFSWSFLVGGKLVQGLPVLLEEEVE